MPGNPQYQTAVDERLVNLAAVWAQIYVALILGAVLTACVVALGLWLGRWRR